MTEAAPQRAPEPRFAAASLIAVIFINMLGFGIIVPLLPFYAKSFDAPPWQMALIFSAYSVGAFFGEPFWGRLSDRYGRKTVIYFGLALFALGSFVAASASDIWMVILGRMLQGAGAISAARRRRLTLSRRAARRSSA
jgi:MFS family permease